MDCSFNFAIHLGYLGELVIFGCKFAKGVCTVLWPIVRCYIWNALDGKEFLECLNNSPGCFIVKFCNFKPPVVIVHNNEVGFPFQLKQIGCNSFP